MNPYPHTFVITTVNSPISLLPSALSLPIYRIKRRPSLPALALELHQSPNGYHYDATQILSHLYLGSEAIPSQSSLYPMFNVTHIVNVACQVYYPHSENPSEYLQMNIKDDVAEHIAHKFEEAFQVIERAKHR